MLPCARNCVLGMTSLNKMTIVLTTTKETLENTRKVKVDNNKPEDQGDAKMLRLHTEAIMLHGFHWWYALNMSTLTCCAFTLRIQMVQSARPYGLYIGWKKNWIGLSVANLTVFWLQFPFTSLQSNMTRYHMEDVHHVCNCAAFWRESAYKDKDRRSDRTYKR